MAESVIRDGESSVVLVNVFSCTPENQDKLIEAWQRGTDELMINFPGFISANIHRSFDGTRVINYAQWESQQAFQNSLADPKIRAFFAELAQIGTPAPVLGELVSVHRAAVG